MHLELFHFVENRLNRIGEWRCILKNTLPFIPPPFLKVPESPDGAASKVMMYNKNEHITSLNIPH